MLTKPATMKYQKVREYLEHKSLEELQSLQSKFQHLKPIQKRVILSKHYQDSEYDDDPVMKPTLGGQNTTETEFVQDPLLISTMESPKMSNSKVKNNQSVKYEKQRTYSSNIYNPRNMVSKVDQAVNSAKAKVCNILICTMYEILLSQFLEFMNLAPTNSK